MLRLNSEEFGYLALNEYAAHYLARKLRHI